MLSHPLHPTGEKTIKSARKTGQFITGTASFSLVRKYLNRFGVAPGACVLDPFCGTGTTLVECRKLGVASVGLEPNPMTCLASQVKVDWDVDPNALLKHAKKVADRTLRELRKNGFKDIPDIPPLRVNRGRLRNLQKLSADESKLLLKNSISPLPLHKTLVLLNSMSVHSDAHLGRHERLALAKALVTDIGNLHFGPEVGVGPQKADAPVVSTWLNGVRVIADDLRALQGAPHASAVVHRSDARQLLKVLEPESVDAVITSPPYPNEKDYTRTTRLESVLLGFLQNKQELRALKQDLLRSNTRGVYKTDQDDLMVAGNAEVQRIAAAIEERRIELGKTSGFERMYARVTRLYFGGMAQHLSELRKVLRPGANLAYVVGDQASYLQVMIRTGQLLADIAESLGYERVGIDLFRTRSVTATKGQIREEVVLLRWPGPTV